MKKIAIIGFGFCGIMVFGNILKKISQEKSKNNIKFIIFEKDGLSSVGAGFSNFNDNYILNVPVKKMSPFDDQPNCFLDFLQENYPAIYEKSGADGFVPRNIYGEFLKKIRQEFFQLASDLKIEYEVFEKQVLDVEDGFKIVGDGIIIEADEVVLSSSFRQSQLNYVENDENFISSLWSKNSVNFHKKNNFNIDDKICIIGTGLSSVDVLVGLNSKNFSGKIYAISRRGNFPKPHFSHHNILPTNNQIDIIDESDARAGIINISLKFRNFLRNYKTLDLRHLIDSIRPKTKSFWHNLDEKNKKLFLKKILPYWNIFRHRVPNISLEIIDKMIKNNQLQIFKNSIKSIHKKNNKFVVDLGGQKIECDYLINCLGFDFNVKNYPLINSMLNKNLLKKDMIFMHSNNSNIHLVGGLNISRDFEITAVPDLRVDANLVANKIFANI
ncbi:MAG: FAD/NAD(P)-binding protein [Rickettsiales bacterium]